MGDFIFCSSQPSLFQVRGDFTSFSQIFRHTLDKTAFRLCLLHTLRELEHAMDRIIAMVTNHLPVDVYGRSERVVSLETAHIAQTASAPSLSLRGGADGGGRL